MTTFNKPLGMSEAETVAELVDANHILFNERVVDAFGHVSARHPVDPHRFFLARSMAPALVEKSDIMLFDLDGVVVGDDSRPVYLERFIHSAIYRARPDVHAIVHSHSAAVIPFGVVKARPLRPVCHMGGFLGGGPPVFEIREEVGAASDLLIRNSALGGALARKLADDAVVLMRGHGSTAVGSSIRQAVFRAIYTEKSAAMLADALKLGDVELLTTDEADAAARTNDAQIDRPWQLWKMAADAARGI
ncbi:class II aldolase/adducin family protein [Burkholderia cepacia]|uniref:class II aldolase/adducin family protein n=1 Tax=Burkholderia cepacia TaxID=292 RepID=UPI002AB62B94|nr:class II aldolase/adducin family protein [Burkholderia cepacia]